MNAVLGNLSCSSIGPKVGSEEDFLCLEPVVSFLCSFFFFFKSSLWNFQTILTASRSSRPQTLMPFGLNVSSSRSAIQAPTARLSR